MPKSAYLYILVTQDIEEDVPVIHHTFIEAGSIDSAEKLGVEFFKQLNPRLFKVFVNEKVIEIPKK